MARDKQFQQQVKPQRPKPQRQPSQPTPQMQPPVEHPLLALLRRLPNRTLQRLAQQGEFTAPPDVEARLASQRGRGEPLPQPVRAQMESALGANLDAVRIHRDGQANALSHDLGARAFTHGADVFFAEGEFAPASEGGQRVLAHELAHVMQQRDGAKLLVGAVHDPAEAEADAVAEQVVRGLRSQAQHSATPLQRQATPEEEEEEAQALRRQDEAPDEEEEAQTLRRRVDVNVLNQTVTEAAVRAMTTVELRQQVALLERWPEMDAPQRENLTLLQAELQQREGALSAAGTAELAQQCNRELGRLQRWMLSPGGLALQTLRAYDSAVGNFVDNTEATSSGGMQFSDIFGLVLAAIPFAGPIARWVGQEALRQATAAVAQAAAGTAVSRATSLSEAATAREEQSARATFAAQIRGESAVLADTLARNTDGVLSAYERAVDSAQQAGNADALRVLLVHLQHENDQVRMVSLERYADLSRQFEIELYRRHYRTRGYIHEYASEAYGVHSREVRGIPDAVQEALRGRLRAGRNMLEIAEAWGLRREVTRTSGGWQ